MRDKRAKAGQPRVAGHQSRRRGLIQDLLARLKYDPTLSDEPVRIVVRHRGRPGDRLSLSSTRRELRLLSDGFGCSAESFVPYHGVLELGFGDWVWKRGQTAPDGPEPTPAGLQAVASAPELDEEVLSQLQDWQLGLDPTALLKLNRYHQMLTVWNQTHNLVSRSLDSSSRSRLIVDCLAALTVLGVGKQKLADVGSGAGLPGVPLAVAAPSLSVTLIEPQEKRVAFLDSVVRSLGLKNVTLQRGRVEGFESAGFDTVAVRALNWRSHEAGLRAILKPQGKLLSYGVDSEPVPSGWVLDGQFEIGKVKLTLLGRATARPKPRRRPTRG